MDGRLLAGRVVLFPPLLPSTPLIDRMGVEVASLQSPWSEPVLSGRWKESRITKALTEAVAYIPRQAVNWLPQPCLLRRHGYLA